MKNSVLHAFGSFGVAVLNLALLFGYARILGPEKLGSLVSSQAQVFIWAFLVDLGLSNGLIGALTLAEGDRVRSARQGFRARDLVFRVAAFRMGGALVGTAGVFFLASSHAYGDQQLFWQDMAFTPYLFGLALQQTLIAYASYLRLQKVSSLCNVAGTLLGNAVLWWMAAHQASILELLLWQSILNFIPGIFLLFAFWSNVRARRRTIGSRRSLRSNRGPWAKAVWRILSREAWPYAVTFTVTLLWSRLDQIVVNRYLGNAAAGQYAVAVRIIGMLLMLSSALSFSIFGDVQRLGRDAPSRIATVIGALTKVIYRCGVFVAGILIIGMAAALGPFLPKFSEAIYLLPHFVLGVWAYWIQLFFVNALFGLRRYRYVIHVHFLSLLIFLPALFVFPYFLGLVGVVWAFNLFCFSMVFWSYSDLKKSGIVGKDFSLFGSLTKPEMDLWEHSGLSLLSHLHRGRFGKI